MPLSLINGLGREFVYTIDLIILASYLLDIENKKPLMKIRGFFTSVPGEIRTPDRRLRRPLLYPAELLGHVFIFLRCP